MSPNLTFLFEIMDAVSSGLRRRGDLPACYQRSVQSQHLGWYGVHKCIRYGQLACFGRHYECWKVYKVLEHHMLLSRWRLFQGRPCVVQRDNAKPHTVAITTAWLHSRGFRVQHWPACSPDLSPTENIWHSDTGFQLLKSLWSSLTYLSFNDVSKTTTNSSADENLYQAKIGPNSNTKTTETHNLDAQTSSNCFEKKRRCYTMVNMTPSQLFWYL